MEDIRLQLDRTQAKHDLKVTPELLSKMFPCGWKVMIEVEAVEKISAGGIVLAKTAEQFRREQGGRSVGKIFSIGKSAWDDCPEPWAKIGDTVFFKRYSGPELRFKTDTKSYFIINDKDIDAVLPKELAEEIE